ncbi:MAG: aminotransferase class I/II-fold pyridoxal phosphate-dependent enzyme [Bacteroidota bacterium]|nr:aminotransferase class I/II-fold pyridoxal phosphate-dependent enzyme [Bacteroidota bacterium]
MQILSLRTRSIHAGESEPLAVPSVAPPLHMANSYLVDAGQSFSAEDLDDTSPLMYSRWANPTVAQLERRIAALEQTENAICFASGMSAITGLFTETLHTGDHLIMTDVGYAGALEYTHDILPQMGVQVTHVDTSDIRKIAAAVQPNTRLIHVETPCNPILRLTDIRAAAEVAHEAGALLSVDSTFASPLVTQPAELGANVVMHSLTKYLGGHGDALGGVLAGPRDVISSIRRGVGIHVGGILSPFNAWLILRGMATLALRMPAHSRSALQVAQFLSDHPHVSQVIYPGLSSHPQYDLANTQMAMGSGMIAFQVENLEAMAVQLQKRLKLISYAVSLGDVRSLVFHIATDAIMESSFRLAGEALDSYRRFAGDGIFRLSVGLESPDDLCADLDQALA